jgi:hypothetical protein
MSVHAAYIRKRIEQVLPEHKLRTIIIDTPHEYIVKDFANNICTNLIHDVFTPAYLKRFPCAGCNGKSEQRCHGKGEERPELLRRALRKVNPDITVRISLREIMVAFLEEHTLSMGFTFKCAACHKDERKSALSNTHIPINNTLIKPKKKLPKKTTVDPPLSPMHNEP